MPCLVCTQSVDFQAIYDVIMTMSGLWLYLVEGNSVFYIIYIWAMPDSIHLCIVAPHSPSMMKIKHDESPLSILD